MKATRTRRGLVALLLMALPTLSVWAQGDDMGVWYSVAADKKINQQVTIGAEGEFRTRNNSKTADRWSAGVNADYKIVRGLKLSAGHIFL